MFTLYRPLTINWWTHSRKHIPSLDRRELSRPPTPVFPVLVNGVLALMAPMSRLHDNWQTSLGSPVYRSTPLD